MGVAPCSQSWRKSCSKAVKNEPVAPHLEAAASSKFRIVESVLFESESSFAKAAVEPGPRGRLERGRVLAGEAVDQSEVGRKS